ncbi:hypothetical protein I5168_11545 [Nonlabens sp. SCSIO 43208]|uniref:hypothetical protein n=1 Tax=Nonlabens sp. SCSIO 43208 TaxID=2793009 RepID=UPI003D6BC300
MSNSSEDGALMGLMWIVTIGISIGSGFMAWNWVDPDSFIGAIGFLIIWGVLSKIGHFIAMALVAIIGGANS